MNTNRIKPGIANQSIKLALVGLFFLNANSCINFDNLPSFAGSGNDAPESASATAISQEEKEEQQKWVELEETTDDDDQKPSKARIEELKAYIKTKPGGASNLREFAELVGTANPLRVIAAKLVGEDSMEDAFKSEVEVPGIANDVIKELNENGGEKIGKFRQSFSVRFSNQALDDSKLLEIAKKKINSIKKADPSKTAKKITEELVKYIDAITEDLPGQGNEADTQEFIKFYEELEV